MATQHHCRTGWHVVPQVWCYYKHQCTCPGCVDGYRAHARRQKQRLNGHVPLNLVDAASTRAKINVLLDAGWTMSGIARQVGCHQKTISAIRRGLAKRASTRVRDGVDRLWRATTCEAIVR